MRNINQQIDKKPTSTKRILTSFSFSFAIFFLQKIGTTTDTNITYSACGRTFCCTYGYPTPCTYANVTCRCDDGGGGAGTFYCFRCVGRGPSDYLGNGTCYYYGYYYSVC